MKMEMKPRTTRLAMMTMRMMTRTKTMVGKKLMMAIQRVDQKMRKLNHGINYEEKLSVT